VLRAGGAAPSANTEAMANQQSQKPVETAVELAERAARAARGALSALGSRRGLPLAVAGAFIVALAWIGERDSAWGFPMLIAGGLMIALGLLGPRLSGSMALRWGDDGAYFQLTSAVAPPGQRRSSPQLQDPAAVAKTGEESLIPPSEIEGEAETIDFKVHAAGSEPEPAEAE